MRVCLHPGPPGGPPGPRGGPPSLGGAHPVRHRGRPAGSIGWRPTGWRPARPARPSEGRSTRSSWRSLWPPRTFKDADRIGLNIRREDGLLFLADKDHVGLSLAGAQQPVNLVARRVIAANRHVRLGGEVELAVSEPQAVRTAQRGQIDAVQLLAGRDVDDGDGVSPLCAGAAVIACESEFPIGGHSQLVRVLADRDMTRDLAGLRVNDGHCVLALMQDQQRRRWSLLRPGSAAGHDTDNDQARHDSHFRHLHDD